MSNNTDYLQATISYDFWQSVYFIKHCQYFNQELFNYADSIYSNLSQFDKYIKSEQDKEDHFHIRGILASYFSLFLGVEPINPLPSLSNEEENIIHNLLEFCLKYQYFPWTIVTEIDAEEIFKFLAIEKKIPPPPLIFTIGNDGANKLTSLFLYAGLDYQGNVERTKEFNASHDITISTNPTRSGHCLDKSKQELELKWRNRDFFNEIIEKGKVKSSLKINEYSKTRKHYEEQHFSVKSNYARAIGLILWQKKLDNNMSNTQAVKWFIDEYKTFFKEIEGAYNSLTSQGVVDKWIRKTEQCIKDKQVLDFK